VGLLRPARALEVAERPDRASDQNGRTCHLPGLAGELDSALDDLLEAVVEQLGGELAPVRAEGVRLDQLGAGADEPLVDADHGLGRPEICLLGAAEPRDGGRQQRAGPAVGDEHAIFLQADEQPAHRPGG
jgi:hypothetical protein